MRMGDMNLVGQGPYRLIADRENCDILRMDELSMPEARKAWDWVRDRWPTANLDMRDASNARIAYLVMHVDEG